MNIAALRARITIQKNETVVDEFANHNSTWTDYFSCWATASANGRISEEREKSASTHESSLMDFTVRWSSETAAVNSKQYRVLHNGRIYNIQSIDEMDYQRKSRKFRTELAER